MPAEVARFAALRSSRAVGSQRGGPSF